MRAFLFVSILVAAALLPSVTAGPIGPRDDAIYLPIVESYDPQPDGSMRIWYNACPVASPEPRSCDPPQYVAFAVDESGLRAEECERQQERTVCRPVTDRAALP